MTDGELPAGVGVAALAMGGPASLDAVEPFLRELFADPAILGLPGPLRTALARRIARKRAPRSRARYARHGDASPLLAATEAQVKALEEALGAPVHAAMRYGAPRADEALTALRARGVSRVVALPLYPQYSTTTTATSLADLRAAAARAGLPVDAIRDYPTLPGLIEALARAARDGLDGLAADGAARPHVLFTAHGIPLRRVRKGDPYPTQVDATVAAVAARIDAPWGLAFQSRLGPMRWLEPAVDDAVAALADDGVDGLVIQPVTFVCENLETLDDLDRELSGVARERGIAHVRRGAAPGTDPRFIESLADAVRDRVRATNDAGDGTED